MIEPRAARPYTRSLMLDRSLVDDALKLLKGAKRIKCVCHRNPDGDAIGAITGIAQLLEANIPTAETGLYCVDPSPPVFHFLPFVHRIREDLQPTEGDVFLFVDSAEPKLTEYHETFPQIFGGTWPSVVFDHHPTNTKFGAVNIIVPEAASTC